MEKQGNEEADLTTHPSLSFAAPQLPAMADWLSGPWSGSQAAQNQCPASFL